MQDTSSESKRIFKNAAHVCADVVVRSNCTIMSENNSKHIAKNTFFLYFRMILIMLITLYTSRVILNELGVSDYGIYNVVGGVVMMLSFFNSSMASSTQRFLTFELGKGNKEKLRKIFAASLNIHIVIAFVIVLLAETIGLWFVNEKLIIPNDRIIAANWVYQFSILTFCVNIIQVPYNAVLIAHEKMNVFAYISIFEVLLSLGIVFLLDVSPFDKLITYAVLYFAVRLLIRAIYQIYCKQHYIESKFNLYWDKDVYRKLSSFAGWNLFGSVAWLLRDQGLNIILNMFFGSAINAAKGITSQVLTGITTFIYNFQTAINPQITKLYAQKSIKEMENLVYKGIKFSIFLLFCLALPVFLNIDSILGIWLTVVPEKTSVFIQLVLIDSIISTLFGNPLMTSMSATGKIRNYQIIVSTIIMMIIPLSWLALKLGYPAQAVFIVMIFISAISGVVRFLFCKKFIGFSAHKYLKDVINPILRTILLALPLPLIARCFLLNNDSYMYFFVNVGLDFFVPILLAWFIGMKKSERAMVLSLIHAKIRRK